MNKHCGCHKTIRFGKGQRLYVLNDPFYIENNGWYVIVQINGEKPFNMSAHFIDELYQKQAVMTWMDLELHMNYQKHQIDKALHDRNEQSFQFYTEEYKKLKNLYDHEAVAQGSQS
ncbi:IDEAL domain-containing protein [Halobacillus faecis]